MAGTFTFVVVPDTQRLTQRHPETLKRLTDWIVRNKEAHHIQAVLHVGDVVHSLKSDAEFGLAHAEWGKVDDAGIPLFMAMGNHDYDNHLEQDRQSDFFNRYLGMQRYRGKSWFGGVFEEERVENVYGILEAAGKRYLILVLEFGPRDAVLQWAERVLTQHADIPAIVLTHAYMYFDGERSRPGVDHHPRDYHGTPDANDGEEVWQKLVSRHANILAVFSGHHVYGNISYRADRGEQGNLVLQSFQNWQETEGGGFGRIRLVEVNPETNAMRLRVYNAHADTFEETEGCEVDFSFQQEENASVLFPGKR